MPALWSFLDKFESHVCRILLAVFVTRPFSLTLLIFAIAAVALPYAPAVWARIRGRRGVGRTVFSEDED